jgi:hypothetical protein
MMRAHLLKHIQDALMDAIDARFAAKRSSNFLKASTRFRISSHSLMCRMYRRFGRARQHTGHGSG